MRRQIVKALLWGAVSLVIFWAPFLLKIDKFWGIEFGRKGMETIVQNFDGLNFIVVAKSWYQPEKIEVINQAFLTGNEPIYFSAHYPVTAGVIWLLNRVMNAPRAVMTTIVLANVLLAYGLYRFFAEFVSKKSAGWLTTVGLFLPARILAVRGVLSSETIFIPLTLLALVMLKRKQRGKAAIWGMLAVLTRSPGILFFVAILISGWMRGGGERIKRLKTLWPYLLMPAALLWLWGFYGGRYGSFWAYFQSGDNLHLFFPPFRVFGTNEAWISGMWREEIIYIYLFLAGGVGSWVQTIKKKKGLAMKTAIYYPVLLLLTIAFVSHRDIARYSLPAAPFAIAGFAKFLERRWVRRLIILMLVPIYLYGWQFILSNIQPINDWTALL